jgi:hypothetical protein
MTLVLLGSASATTISDYPEMFFEKGEFTATITKGNVRDSAQRAATNILIRDLQKSMAQHRIKPFVRETTKNSGNEIVIGTPCGSHRARELLNVQAGKCMTALPYEQGKIMLFQNEHTTLLITGTDGQRILDAVKILIDPRQREALKRTDATIVRIQRRERFAIGNNRQLLQIGQTIGEVTTAIK